LKKKNFLKTDENLAKQGNIVNNSIVANKSYFLILKHKVCLKICMIKELVTKNLNLFIYMKLLRNTLKNTSLNIFSKGKINLKLF